MSVMNSFQIKIILCNILQNACNFSHLFQNLWEVKDLTFIMSLFALRLALVLLVVNCFGLIMASKASSPPFELVSLHSSIELGELECIEGLE